jgi:hypothetical protein
MPMYRIYLLDAAGSFRSRDDHECDDDTAANELATTLLTQNAQADIWIGTRRVGLVVVGQSLDARALQIVY